ncbi:MAG: hypothetical protein LBB27_02270 [Tannerellaceae bacterium]|jgi:hypothetical protein|nr:hypothetical protein [Tannerellaceae bacterium]
MKKFSVFLAAILMICCMTTVKADDYVYCELVGSQKFLSTKWNVHADYGQAASFKDRFKGSTLALAFSKSKEGVTFNSMVDALNYFGAQGWEFVQAYVIQLKDGNELRWILRRPASADDMEAIKSEVSAGEEDKK